MFSNTVIDPVALLPVLAGLGLDGETEPVLIYVREGTQARVRMWEVDWARYGVAACISGLAYRCAKTLEPDTDAIGVWLPAYQSVIVVDATMHAHQLPLDDKAIPVPQRELLTILRELRALVGAALTRPGRLSLEPPVIISAQPAYAAPLVDAVIARGLEIRTANPAEATASWERAVEVFVLAEVLADVVALAPAPRADVTILASARTQPAQSLANALGTSDFLAWPSCAEMIADNLVHHREAQSHARAGRYW